MNPPPCDGLRSTVARRTFMSQGAVNRLRHYSKTVWPVVDALGNVARARARGSGFLEHPPIRVRPELTHDPKGQETTA